MAKTGVISPWNVGRGQKMALAMKLFLVRQWIDADENRKKELEGASTDINFKEEAKKLEC